MRFGCVEVLVFVFFFVGWDCCSKWCTIAALSFEATWCSRGLLKVDFRGGACDCVALIGGMVNCTIWLAVLDVCLVFASIFLLAMLRDHAKDEALQSVSAWGCAIFSQCNVVASGVEMECQENDEWLQTYIYIQHDGVGKLKSISKQKFTGKVKRTKRKRKSQK